MLCSPQILLNLAAVISEHVPAFSAYDEFSKHYEMLRYGIDEAQRTMNDWYESVPSLVPRVTYHFAGPNTTLHSRRWRMR